MRHPASPLSVAMAFFLFFPLGSTCLPAQETPALAFKPLVDLNSVAAQLQDGKGVLRIRGRANRVPAGTILEIALHYSFQELEKFEFTLDASRRIDAQLPSTRINGFATGLYVSVSIPYEKQSREVRESIDKNPEDFPPAHMPWRSAYGELTFAVGSDAELQRQGEATREFFKTRILKLVALDRRMGELLGRAESGAGFVVDGKLDPETWMQAVEKEVRDPLREVQREITEAGANLSYLALLRDVDYLRELASSVAQRSIERSRALFQNSGLPLDARDVSPQGLNTSTKGRPTPQSMERLVKRLCDSQGISLP